MCPSQGDKPKSLFWRGNTCCKPGPLLVAQGWVAQGDAFHAGLHSILCPQQTAVCLPEVVRAVSPQDVVSAGDKAVWLQTSHLSCLCRRANIVLTNAIVCRGSAGLGTAHHTGPVQVWQQLTQSLSSFISQNSKFSRKALSLQPLQLTRIILSTYTRDEFIPVCSNPIGSQDHLTVGNVRQKIESCGIISLHGKIIWGTDLPNC